MTTATDPRPLLTSADVAHLLGCSGKTVRRLAREGKLPHLRLNRSLRFEPTALEALRVAAGVPEPSAA